MNSKSASNQDESDLFLYKKRTSRRGRSVKKHSWIKLDSSIINIIGLKMTPDEINETDLKVVNRLVKILEAAKDNKEEISKILANYGGNIWAAINRLKHRTMLSEAYHSKAAADFIRKNSVIQQQNFMRSGTNSGVAGKRHKSILQIQTNARAAVKLSKWKKIKRVVNVMKMKKLIGMSKDENDGKKEKLLDMVKNSILNRFDTKGKDGDKVAEEEKKAIEEKPLEEAQSLNESISSRSSDRSFSSSES